MTPLGDDPAGILAKYWSSQTLEGWMIHFSILTQQKTVMDRRTFRRMQRPRFAMCRYCVTW